MTFDLRLFGGLEICDSVVSGVLTRRLVALLAARRNLWVPKWDIIRGLWDDQPPASAEGTLSAMMSRLRVSTQPSEALTIPEAVSGSYIFLVEASACDLDTFELRSRNFLEDPVNRVEAAKAALELWHGEPFGEFTQSPFALVESIRLARIRDAVELGLIEALLVGRRHAEALINIDALAARTELDQSLFASRMRALAGLGRHREALQSLDRYSRRVRESGNVLTATLIEWEQRLLNAESESDDPADLERTHAHGFAGGRYTVDAYFGQIDALETVRAMAGESRMLTIIGEGGIGKSRLAVEALAEQRTLWCDLATATSIDDVRHQLGRLAGIEDPTASLGAIIDGLGGSDVPLVLDGCPVGLVELPGLVGDLLARTPLKILATARHPLGLSGERLYRVAPLPFGDPLSPAVALLVDRARAAGAGVDRDNPIISKIAERLDGHPLAIEIVAPRLALLTPDDVLSGLADGRGWPEPVDGNRRSMEGTIQPSYGLLPPSTQLLFRCLAVFDGGLGSDVARSLVESLDLGPNSALSLLQLAEHSLIRSEVGLSGELRYRILAPIADVARNLIEDPEASLRFRRARVVALIHLLESAEAAGFGSQEARWVDAVAEEMVSLRSARDDCIRYGWLDLHARLIAGLLEESGLRDNADVQWWSIELAAQEHLADVDRGSVVLAIAANAALVRDDLAAAAGFAARSEELASAGQEPSWLALNTLYYLAMIDGDGFDDARAAEHLESMRRRSATGGDPLGGVLADFNVAFVAATLGRPFDGVVAAINCSRRARHLQSPALSSMARLAVASVRLQLNPRRAIEQLIEAEELARRGRCVIVERHATRARLNATIHVAPVAILEWLAAHRYEEPIAKLLQEVCGVLVPLARAGQHDLVARLCGGLSRTVWGRAAAVQAATLYLESAMGLDAFRLGYRRGRRLNVQQVVGTALEALDPPVDVLGSGV